MPTPITVTFDTSDIVDGEPIDANDVLIPLNDAKTLFEDVLNGDQYFYQTNYGAAEEVTIAGGVIDTDGRAYLKVDTEANAASDDLDTIDGGVEGDVIYLRLENAARVVVFKHNTGNIYLSSGLDYTLSDANRVIKLFRIGSLWTDFGSGASQGTLKFYDNTLTSDGVFSITNIPAGYSSMEVELLGRSDVVSTADNCEIIFNNDTGANYSALTRLITSSSVTTNSQNGASNILLTSSLAGTTANADTYGSVRLQIPSYSKAIKKVIQIFAGDIINTNPNTATYRDGVAWYFSTTAISRIDITPENGTNFKAGSQCRVYLFP